MATYLVCFTWTQQESIRSKYKEDFRVAFPPFSFFVDFVKREVKACNDPSFNTMAFFSPVQKKDKKQQQNTHLRAQNSVSTETSKADKAVENPDKQCPVHHRPHPLCKCRGFRAMLPDERKRVLKDNTICFRCCASTVHQAKNCDVVVKCTECDSEKHVTALHPGPAPQLPKLYPPLKENGGEEEATRREDITTKGSKFRRLLHARVIRELQTEAKQHVKTLLCSMMQNKCK